MRAGIFVGVGIVIAAAIGGAGVNVACEGGNCRMSELGGCLDLGTECSDALTGCGACLDLVPLVGPCVCDPATSPQPDPIDDYESETDIGEDEPALFEIALVPDGETEAAYRPGSRLCARQLDPVEVRHHYGSSWMFAPSDRLVVERTRFCVEMLGALEGASDWVQFVFVDFEGRVPSFRPGALPLVETGPNVVELSAVPSRGKLHLPTGTVLAEVHARLSNDLFPSGAPVPLRAGLRGKVDLAAGIFALQGARLSAITPPSYDGPTPW